MADHFAYSSAMGRPWRIEYAGALYHVLSRGNEGRNIFVHDSDRWSFLNILKQSAERFDLEIYAFVLMGNHYHLLFKTLEPNLSKAMQWVGVTYTRRFNLKHNRKGHLFQGRFQSIIVENEAYLMRLSCYIHRNPLRAGLVNRLADYKWSSYRTYAYGYKGYEWLSTQLIFDRFEGVPDSQRAYRQTVQSYAHEEKDLWEDFRHGFILGTRDFVDRLRTDHLRKTPDREIPQQKRVAKAVDIKGWLSDAAKALDTDMHRLVHCARIARDDKLNRDALVYSLWKSGLFTNGQIGDMFSLSYSAVSHIVHSVKQNLSTHGELQKKVTLAYSLFKT